MEGPEATSSRGVPVGLLVWVVRESEVRRLPVTAEREARGATVVQEAAALEGPRSASLSREVNPNVRGKRL